MNDFLRIFWQTGLPFGLMIGLFYAFQYDWKEGLAAGAFGGVFFGLLMAAFMHFQSRKFRQNRPLSPDEKLIHEGAANHRGNGGWIYLTDSRLHYVSHKLNFKAGEMSIPLDEIILPEKGRSFGVIPNQLILNLRNGKTEKFVVQNVQGWIDQINRASDLQIEAARDLYLND